METIYIGLIFIAIGILIKVFPNLLAGYSQLSNREKENATANGLPKFAFIVFSAMGLIIIIGHFVSIWLNNSSLSGSIVVSVSLVGMVVLIVFGNKFTNAPVR